MNPVRIISAVLVAALLIGSCTIEKRRYRDGFYKKRNKKVETSGEKTDPVTENDPPPPPPPPGSGPNYNPAPKYKNPFIQPGLPSFCFYGGFREGYVKLSVNAEKFFSYGPHLNAFGRAGFGFGDVDEWDFTKRFLVSGGVAFGLKRFKLGTEVGFAGYLNGDKGYGFYSGFARFMPGRQSIYLKGSITKAMEALPNAEVKFACAVGIAF